MSPHRRLTAVALRRYHRFDRRADAMEEVAAIVMSRHHTPPTKVPILENGRAERGFVAEWQPPTEAARASWDREDATEWGAELLAIVGVHARRGLVVVRRAQRRSKVDYYLAPAGQGDLQTPDLLEEAVLLEVSGQDRGPLGARLREKKAQAAKNPERLPAIAAVVGFRKPLLAFDDVDLEDG